MLKKGEILIVENQQDGSSLSSDIGSDGKDTIKSIGNDINRLQNQFNGGKGGFIDKGKEKAVNAVKNKVQNKGAKKAAEKGAKEAAKKGAETAAKEAGKQAAVKAGGAALKSIPYVGWALAAVSAFAELVKDPSKAIVIILLVTLPPLIPLFIIFSFLAWLNPFAITMGTVGDHPASAADIAEHLGIDWKDYEESEKAQNTGNNIGFYYHTDNISDEDLEKAESGKNDDITLLDSEGGFTQEGQYVFMADIVESGVTSAYELSRARYAEKYIDFVNDPDYNQYKPGNEGIPNDTEGRFGIKTYRINEKKTWKDSEGNNRQEYWAYANDSGKLYANFTLLGKKVSGNKNSGFKTEVNPTGNEFDSAQYLSDSSDNGAIRTGIARIVAAYNVARGGTAPPADDKKNTYAYYKAFKDVVTDPNLVKTYFEYTDNTDSQGVPSYVEVEEKYNVYEIYEKDVYRLKTESDCTGNETIYACPICMKSHYNLLTHAENRETNQYALLKRTGYYNPFALEKVKCTKTASGWTMNDGLTSDEIEDMFDITMREKNPSLENLIPPYESNKYDRDCAYYQGQEADARREIYTALAVKINTGLHIGATGNPSSNSKVIEEIKKSNLGFTGPNDPNITNKYKWDVYYCDDCHTTFSKKYIERPLLYKNKASYPAENRNESIKVTLKYKIWDRRKANSKTLNLQNVGSKSVGPDGSVQLIRNLYSYCGSISPFNDDAMFMAFFTSDYVQKDVKMYDELTTTDPLPDFRSASRLSEGEITQNAIANLAVLSLESDKSAYRASCSTSSKWAAGIYLTALDAYSADSWLYRFFTNDGTEGASRYIDKNKVKNMTPADLWKIYAPKEGDADYAAHTSLENIPIGAIVIGTGAHSSSVGAFMGQAAIYVGKTRSKDSLGNTITEGEVIHNWNGTIIRETLSQFRLRNTATCSPGGTDSTGNTSLTYSPGIIGWIWPWNMNHTDELTALSFKELSTASYEDNGDEDAKASTTRKLSDIPEYLQLTAILAADYYQWVVVYEYDCEHEASREMQCPICEADVKTEIRNIFLFWKRYNVFSYEKEDEPDQMHITRVKDDGALEEYDDPYSVSEKIDYYTDNILNTIDISHEYQGVPVSNRAGGAYDLVEFAKTQVGTDGKLSWNKVNGGKKDDWCAMFVSMCASECGLLDLSNPDAESTIIPSFKVCMDGARWFSQKNQFEFTTGTYIPQPGDIIFFAPEEEEETETEEEPATTDPEEEEETNPFECDHVGIVVSTSSNGLVTTIEGNSGDSSTDPYCLGSHVVLHENAYTYNDGTKILGYGIPDYENTSFSKLRGKTYQENLYYFFLDVLGFNKAASMAATASVLAIHEKTDTLSNFNLAGHKSLPKASPHGGTYRRRGVLYWHEFAQVSDWCEEHSYNPDSFLGQLAYIQYIYENNVGNFKTNVDNAKAASGNTMSTAKSSVGKWINLFDGSPDSVKESKASGWISSRWSKRATDSDGSLMFVSTHWPNKISLTTAESSDSMLIGDTTEDKIWNYLIGDGYSEKAASAVMANIKACCNFDHKDTKTVTMLNNNTKKTEKRQIGGLLHWADISYGRKWEMSLRKQLEFLTNYFIPMKIRKVDKDSSDYISLSDFKKGKKSLPELTLYINKYARESYAKDHEGNLKTYAADIYRAHTK